MRKFIFIFLTAFLASFPVMSQTPIVPESQVQLKLSFAPLVKKVAPAVVNIYTKRTVANGFRNPIFEDPFFRQFFGNKGFDGQMRDQIEGSLGSGVIVKPEGLVVTNSHVIRGAEVITVGLADGREYDAEIVLSDEGSDLALLRLKDKGLDLPCVRLKPSESLEVGDLVLAIGNPFGVGQTVTSGIVSAQGRSSLDINDYNFFIQTDAAINPGNSGGPLVDMDGDVVGINTAIYSRNGGSMGLGFAIPSEMLESVLAAEVAGQITDSGVVRPWGGIEAQDMTADIAHSLGLDKPSGALISSLHPASPFLTAGLKVGDVILAINGKQIRTASELKFRIAMVPIGKSAKISSLRNGKTFSYDVAAILPPDNPPRNKITLKGKHALNGATICNINPSVSNELGLHWEASGVVVLDVPRGTVAARFVTAGVILREINGMVINAPEDVEKALMLDNAKGGLALKLEQNGRISQIFVR